MIKAIIILFGVLLLFPAYWMINGSLQSVMGFMKFPPRFIPRNPTLNNYQFLFARTPIPRWLVNTVFLWVANSSFAIFCVACAAYAFAFFSFRFKRLLYWIIMFPLVVPGYALIIPRFITMANLGMMGTYWPLILVAACKPTAFVLLMEYFKKLPQSLLDAARVDGLNEVGILFTIILPNCLPVLGFFCITGFSAVYQDILWPLMMLPDRKTHTMVLGVMGYLRNYTTIAGDTAHRTIMTQLGESLAAGVVLVIPLVIVFLVFQRTIRQQFAMGGIKE